MLSKNEEQVMSWLTDDESKYIFKKRVEFNNTGNSRVFRDIVERYIPQLRDRGYYPGMEKRMISILKGKRVILFGAGTKCDRITKLLDENGIKPVGIIDNDENKQNKVIDEIKVDKPEQEKYEDIDIVVVTPLYEKLTDSMVSQLKSMGIEKNKILKYNDYLPKALAEEQYFDKKIINFTEGESFIDGGAYDLETSLKFCSICKNQGIRDYYSYAFEPDLKSFEKCKGVLEKSRTDRIKLINAGLWNEKTVLNFDNRGAITSSITKKDTGTRIDTVSLDDAMDGKNVTFIKLDIEGAELNALKGASDIIRTQHPKLAICIYHKKEDLTEIPMYIKEMYKEYQLSIRHYSDCASETILYAA